MYLQAAVQIPGNLQTETTLSDRKIKGIKMYGDLSEHCFTIECPDKKGVIHTADVPWTNMKIGFLTHEDQLDAPVSKKESRQSARQ